jgi:hypothetical protein
MEKLTGKFEALGSDGETYAIMVFSEQIPGGTMQDPQAVVEGMKSLRTSDGLHVNRLEKGKYKVVQTGILLHSESPNAA